MGSSIAAFEPDLQKLALEGGPRSGPLAGLSPPATNVRGKAARQHVPAEVAMVRRGTRQRIGVARQDFIADRGQALAEDLADVGMVAALLDDLFDVVAVDVADGELVEIGREAAARFDVAARVDDQGLAGAFAVIFLEPFAVPIGA